MDWIPFLLFNNFSKDFLLHASSKLWTFEENTMSKEFPLEFSKFNRFVMILCKVDLYAAKSVLDEPSIEHNA